MGRTACAELTSLHISFSKAFGKLQEDVKVDEYTHWCLYTRYLDSYISDLRHETLGVRAIHRIIRRSHS